MPSSLLVLVRDRPGPPRPATEWAIGRAALELVRDGASIVFGQTVREGRATGLRLRADGSWESVVGIPVGVVAMRFPRRSRKAIYDAAMAGVRAAPTPIPVVNTPAFSDLCADKLATQHALRTVVSMPEVEADPSLFDARLDIWGAAFLKPRFGSLGDGVQRLERGDRLPRLDGDWLLQRAVDPPAGLAGLCLRVLVQREGDGWVVPPAVARSSEVDPTVSVERGASVGVPEGPAATAMDAATTHALAIASWLGDRGPWDPEDVVEMGVDFVVDTDGRPHVVEVNSIPRGRLAVLAEQDPAYVEAHEAAIRRPLVRMLSRL